MTNIILSGGSGTRLWPLSRSLMPKQFLELFDEKSLFVKCFERNKKLCEKSVIICNENHYFLALEQIKNGGGSCEFLLESIAKNTAAAIAFAALNSNKDEILLITPSDHLIKNENEYQKAILKAKELAKKDFLVTFGIKPTHAETGYGYIKTKDLENVEGFYEKPDLSTAQKYLKSGEYFFNSGMFMFKAGVILEEIKLYANDVYKAALNTYQNAKCEQNYKRFSKEFMQKIPEISIDYAVFEHSNRIKMVPCDISWSDLGSFESLANELKNTETKELNAKNNFVLSPKLVSLIGVDDLIVIDTKDALLISKKGKSHEVKNIVNELKSQNDERIKIHTKAARPWGTYEVLEVAPGYKIKKIIVLPGKRLSLQKHFHRNEHWIVVSGTASVEIDGVKSLVATNESVYIKMGQIHRLANEGKIPLVLIEAQVGEYTGEDDIVRIEDDYKRTDEFQNN